MNNGLKKALVKKINSSSKKYKLVRSKYGHYYVTPVPTASELSEFYEKKYFKDRSLVSSKGMDTGSRDKVERFHYDRQYDETLSFIKQNFKRKDIKILDVGCGMGGFLKYLQGRGFKNLYGTEIDPSFNKCNISIFNGDFLDFDTAERFDFIIFNNVLEHVKSPEALLRKAYAILNNKGFIRVQVPNDLSYTQYKAVSYMKRPNFYFFSPPEHLHYFDFDSMEKMLEANNFKIVKKSTNWPMDIFILMGIDYSKDPAAGRICHNYRTNFEYKMGRDFLATFYAEMAKLGIGRVVIEYAKKI